MFIDSHAHIYSEEFDKDRRDVIAKAVEAGVGKIYMPNVDHTSIDVMLETEEQHKGICIPMMGLHPTYVKKGFEKELYLVEEWLKRRKFAAIGEIGTDLYWDKTNFSIQEEAFKVQINFASQFNLPVAIHCRDSFKETVEIIEKSGLEIRGVFHCFTGTVDDAQKAIELGFVLGIGGVSTYKNGGLDKVLPEIPLEKLILETDCPYLPPVPHRGKRNEPSYIPLIASRVAELKKVTISEVEKITTENAINLFAL